MDGRLHAAISRNDMNRIREILEAGVDTNIVDNNGNTPLHILASKCRITSRDIENDLQVARDLIRFGADVNATNRKLRTPLMMAMCAENCRMVEFLLQANANINNRDNDGNSAMHYALLFSSLAFWMNDENTPQLQIVKTLLKYNPDLDVSNTLTQTPLMLAVKTENLPIVECLLEHNASVNIVDWHNESVLHHAFRYEVIMDIVVELLRHGGDFGLINETGQTPIDIFIINLHTSFITEAKKAKGVFKIFILLQNNLSSTQQQDIERISVENNCQLSEFIWNCIDELNKMLRDELAPNYNVYDMALRGFLKRGKKVQVPTHVSDKVFNKIMKVEYPMYCDLVVCGIGTPYLNKRFAENCLFGSTGRELFNFDVLYDLSFYLSQSDMLSMMVAFSVNNKWDLTSDIWNIARSTRTGCAALDVIFDD